MIGKVITAIGVLAFSAAYAADTSPVTRLALLGMLVESQVQLVDHLCLRCASSQLCRISTAAT